MLYGNVEKGKTSPDCEDARWCLPGCEEIGRCWPDCEDAAWQREHQCDSVLRCQIRMGLKANNDLAWKGIHPRANWDAGDWTRYPVSSIFVPPTAIDPEIKMPLSFSVSDKPISRNRKGKSCSERIHVLHNIFSLNLIFIQLINASE